MPLSISIVSEGIIYYTIKFTIQSKEDTTTNITSETAMDLNAYTYESSNNLDKDDEASIDVPATFKFEFIVPTVDFYRIMEAVEDVDGITLVDMVFNDITYHRRSTLLPPPPIWLTQFPPLGLIVQTRSTLNCPVFSTGHYIVPNFWSI